MHDQNCALFWEFSHKLYACEGVKEQCLFLQDTVAADVNILLLCCWLAHHKLASFTAVDLDVLDRSIAVWRGDVMQPFRSVRMAVQEKDRKSYEALKSAELILEKHAQEQLIGAIPASRLGMLHKDGKDVVDCARRSLTLYLVEYCAISVGQAQKSTSNLLRALEVINDLGVKE